LDEVLDIFYSIKKGKIANRKSVNIAAFSEYHDKIYNLVPKSVRRETKFLEQN
jgi:hypothetical protein